MAGNGRTNRGRWGAGGAAGRAPALGLALLLVLTSLAACGRVQAGREGAPSDLKIGLTVVPDPPAMGPGQMVVTLADKANQPVADATVAVEGDMTHAGMVPVFGTATPGPAGRYDVPFKWSMNGDWIVTVNVTLPDGSKASRQFPVTVGGS